MPNSGIRLLPRVFDGKALLRPWVKDSWGGEPGSGQFDHAFPRQVALLASSSQRLQPYLHHAVTKCPNCTEGGRYRMVRIEPAHNRFKPRTLFRDRVMHSF